MAQPAILHLEQVTKQFPRTPQPAVSNITLTLPQGHVLGLLGPSGCGKTTLLRLVAGFEQPQKGRIEVAGQVVAQTGVAVPPEQRSLGMVFQDFALFPHLTVGENIAFGLKQTGRQARSQVRERVSEAIALVGLEGFEQRYPHELSGGQQQRVALARALAPRPALILLDEPLSNLDVQVRLYLRQEVRDILKSTGTSAIFVTHDQEEALAIADQVAVMRQGHIEQLGTPEQVYGEPASQFVAEFVTQANFIAARQQGEFWETAIGRFALANTRCTCQADWDICREEANTGTLMIRQEDLRLVADESGSVVVRDRQFLGREYSYWLEASGGLKLKARTSVTTNLPIGSRVQLSVADATLQLFPTLSNTKTPVAIATS